MRSAPIAQNRMMNATRSTGLVGMEGVSTSSMNMNMIA